MIENILYIYERNGVEIELTHEDALTNNDHLVADAWKHTKTVDKYQYHLGKALALLRDLADIQNGPPLVQDAEDWSIIMDKVYIFLKQHEA